MRDLALIAFLSVFVPLTLRYPMVGFLLWVWIALMNPHKMVFGFLADAQINFGVAALTVLAWLISREPKRLQVSAVTILLIIFAAWFSMTTFTIAVSPTVMDNWDRNIKNIALVLMAIILIVNRERLQGLIWVMVISLGFYAVRNGAQTIVSGGLYIKGGPPQTYIGDNNNLALAIVMTIPLLIYLWQTSRHWIVRVALSGSIFLSSVAVLGSYSRGGFIAFGAMTALLWLRSRAKIRNLAIMAAVVFAAISLVPERYTERISTINNAGEDESFQQRLRAWTVALNVAIDRPLGAGFEGPIQPQVWTRYFPEGSTHAAHSIYFMVLGEHGFFGLAIYLVLCFAAWNAAGWTRKRAKGVVELDWLFRLSSMTQVSLFGFFVGGAALSMAYYDGFLLLTGIACVLPRMYELYRPSEAEGRILARPGLGRVARPANVSPDGMIGVQPRRA